MLNKDTYLNSYLNSLNSKHSIITLVLLQTVLLTGLLGSTNSAKADVETLFTTAQERQVIDNNRYKTNPIVKPRPANETELTEPTAQVEVKLSYIISGITISNSGPHSVWINNKVYEDGEQLDDNSHIKVLTDKNIRVRITTPDGKNYYGTSGETIEVTYLDAVKTSDEAD